MQRDDREEFEQDHVLRDREEESEIDRCERETGHARVPGTFFCRCTHVMDDGDERTTYGEMAAGGRVGEFLPPSAEEIAEYEKAFRREAIRQDLRRQVEEAVERLRYTDYFDRQEGTGITQVFEVEPFLAELDRIFGERPEEQAHPREWAAIVSDLRDLAARPLDGAAMRFGPMEARQILSAIGGLPMMTDADQLAAMRAEQDFLMEHGVIHAYPATSLPEHEPADDRRERHAAKFEHEGRVEGVDR